MGIKKTLASIVLAGALALGGCGAKSSITVNNDRIEIEEATKIARSALEKEKYYLTKYGWENSWKVYSSSFGILARMYLGQGVMIGEKTVNLSPGGWISFNHREYKTEVRVAEIGKKGSWRYEVISNSRHRGLMDTEGFKRDKAEETKIVDSIKEKYKRD